MFPQKNEIMLLIRHRCADAESIPLDGKANNKTALGCEAL